MVTKRTTEIKQRYLNVEKSYYEGENRCIAGKTPLKQNSAVDLSQTEKSNHVK